MPRKLTELLSELDSVGIKTVKELVELIERWSGDTNKHSQEIYKQTEKNRDLNSPVSKYYSWQDKTSHYYTPLAHVRLSMNNQFPDFYNKKRTQQAGMKPVQ